ncbi:MAG: hypothetical protein IK130_06470 [Oscillospiraceae bacterium]|nr:hypothetical protein [Oscillospiraceae bacterium]
MFIGMLDVILGVALLAVNATEWKWLGSFADKITMRDKKGFRIAMYIVGAVLVVMGIVMLLLT